MLKTLSVRENSHCGQPIGDADVTLKGETRAQLLRIQRFCINDGPGIRTTVFLQGCALRCKWCHNPESQTEQPILMYNARLCVGCQLCVGQCPNYVHSFVDGLHQVDFERCEACGECLKTCMSEALTLHGRDASIGEVIAEILQDRDYYESSGGGVTISGGEPLRQPEFVIKLAKACRAEGIQVYLDTCGFAAETTFMEVCAVVDGFLYDVKMTDREAHKVWTGRDNDLILENFGRAVTSGKAVRMRVILIPGITDTQENLEGLVQVARARVFRGPIDLMPYHRMGAGKYHNMGMDYAMDGVEPPTRLRLEEVAAFFEGEGFQTTIQ
jgi:pyruvate formate lyase activating enzyme